MSAAKTFEEAHERHKTAHEGGPRWVPVTAAGLAVLAAVAGYVSNIRATQAIIAKNDSIVATARATDTYNEYEAGRIKYYVSQVALDAGVRASGNATKLQANITRETAKGPPLLAKARHFEADAETLNHRSEHLLAQHETIEVASTLFEVSIVLVSITALLGSRILPVAAGVATAAGMVIFIVGLLY